MLNGMNTRAEIEADIYEKASVNREHLLAFLRLIPTNDSQVVEKTVKVWLQRLHDDPHFSKVSFPQADGEYGSAIDRIIGDLQSFGRVTQETILDAPPAPEVRT